MHASVSVAGSGVAAGARAGHGHGHGTQGAEGAVPCCQGCQPRAVLQVLPIDGGAQREAREAASAARLRAEVETLRSELAVAKTRLDAAEETNRCRTPRTYCPAWPRGRRHRLRTAFTFLLAPPRPGWVPRGPGVRRVRPEAPEGSAVAEGLRWPPVASGVAARSAPRPGAQHIAQQCAD